MTLLFDWMSSLFMGFVFVISSLVILCSDGYISGDLSIFRFIILILIFVVSMVFLFVSSS
jgi:NADH-ubiquinone oxidoreductase chain 5